MKSELDENFLIEIKPKFYEFLTNETGLKWIKEREDKDVFFKKYFNEESIEKIDEGILRELFHILWAFIFWSNKDYLLDQMLVSGLSEIITAFKDLLYGSETLAKRFDKMRDIKVMGAASISEILCHHDHNKYPIWNRRAKDGLIKLGVDPNLIPKSSQIRGNQYENYCSLVRSVHKQVQIIIPDIQDLLQLDLLLYYVSTVVGEPFIEKVREEVEIEFDHDSTVQDILQLGDGLGFDVQKEVTLAKGCRIDAIWRTRIANLGTIKYAFEVHKKGSKDSAILNLLKSRTDSSIQKVIIVSTEEELNAFKNEISDLSEEFRKSVGYFDIVDLQKALEYQENIKNILINIGLQQ